MLSVILIHCPVAFRKFISIRLCSPARLSLSLHLSQHQILLFLIANLISKIVFCCYCFIFTYYFITWTLFVLDFFLQTSQSLVILLRNCFYLSIVFYWYILFKNFICILLLFSVTRVFPGGSNSKESACNARDPGSIPGSRRSPGEGNGDPLQYFCLENSMDRGAWWATVHGVTFKKKF